MAITITELGINPSIGRINQVSNLDVYLTIEGEESGYWVVSLSYQEPNDVNWHTISSKQAKDLTAGIKTLNFVWSPSKSGKYQFAVILSKGGIRQQTFYKFYDVEAEFTAGFGISNEQLSQYLAGTLFVDGIEWPVSTGNSESFSLDEGSHIFDIVPPIDYRFVKWQVYWSEQLIHEATERPLVYSINQDLMIYAIVEPVTVYEPTPLWPILLAIGIGIAIIGGIIRKNKKW